jgi:excisionase family DNA binding protein
MTVDQVADYLQLNRLTVYRYVREGKIPASKIGKLYRILRADVDRFLEAQKVTTPAAAASRRQRQAVEPRAHPVSVKHARPRFYTEERQPAPPEAERPQPMDRLGRYSLDWTMRGLH